MTYWSPCFGIGVLVWHVGGKLGEMRFDPESGAPALSFRWVEAKTGKPDKRPRRKADAAEWDRWNTFKTRAGETFTFRRDAAPQGTPS